jgi:hypothetical protein
VFGFNQASAVSSFAGAICALLVAGPGCSQPTRGSAGAAPLTVEIFTVDDARQAIVDRLEVGPLIQGSRFEQIISLRNGTHVARRIPHTFAALAV